MTVGLIAYDGGNIRSVSNALERLGCGLLVSQVPNELSAADKIIFPGVGEARNAIEHLTRNGLDHWLRTTTKPLLGICLGMQLLFERSTERDTECLGILPGTVDIFREGKVPHMGWN